MEILYGPLETLVWSPGSWSELTVLMWQSTAKRGQLREPGQSRYAMSKAGAPLLPESSLLLWLPSSAASSHARPPRPMSTSCHHTCFLNTDSVHILLISPASHPPAPESPAPIISHLVHCKAPQLASGSAACTLHHCNQRKISKFHSSNVICLFSNPVY